MLRTTDSISEPRKVSISDEDGELLGVEVGATFFTGIEIDDASSVLGRVQESAAERLSRCTSVPFRPARPSGNETVDTYYAIDGDVHGSEVVPLVFASVEPAWLLSQLDVDGLDGWVIVRAECDIHDFGVGMLVVTWAPTSDFDVEAEGLDVLLATLTAASSATLAGVVGTISAACQDTLCSDPRRMDLTHGLDISAGEVLPTAGSILWLWHLLLVSTAPGNQRVLATAVASAVCPNGFELVAHRDHAFAAGVHASVACSERNLEDDARYLWDAPRLKDAWWTMYWRLDRVLLGLQLHLKLTEASMSLQELERRATLLREVRSRVNLWRSRLDSILVASGARDNDAWQALGRAWRMDRHVEVVDRKMAVLDQSYSAAIDQIRAARSRRVDLMIYLFTAFSVVASVVAVAEYAQGSPDGRVAVRASIVLLSLVTAISALVLSLRARSSVARAR